MLANGLAHGIPVSVMRAVPARSVGPAARIVALHEDLVDWQAMRTAVEHMDATVAAAAEGRRWLDGISRLAGADQAAMALGVVALTQPTLAATMARHDVAATQALLRTAGVEALARFAGFHVEPRGSYAEAFAHRFPAQLAKGPLTETDPHHLAGPDAAAVPHRPGRSPLDLGL